MTLAICWKCGSRKVGALTACANCGAFPVDPHDKATSLLLSDHYQDRAALDSIGESIARGEPPQFDETEFAQLLSVMREEPRMPWGCVVAVWTPIVLLALLLGFVAWLFIAGAYR